MNAMNFRTQFIHMTKILHKDSAVVLTVNKELSKSIPISDGIRQGCLISPPLFAINTKLLRSLICSREMHKEINILGVNLLVELYANDTCGYIIGKKDLHAFRARVATFYEASRVQLNIEKSSIIFLRKLFDYHPLEVVKKGSTDRLLGFLLKVEAPDDVIHEPVLNKFKNCSAKWAGATISTHRKAAMMRTFAESTVEYTAPFHAYSNSSVKKIKNTYWKGIYNTKKITKQR